MPGDDTSISASTFIDGTKVRWKQLATTIAGAFALVYSLGVTSIVSAISAAYVSLLGGVSGFVFDVISALGSIPVDVADAAYGAAETFVYGLGVSAPVIGVLIGLVTLYVLLEGIYG